MPELSTLTTVITADTSGFSAGVSKVVSDAEKMRSSVTQSIGGGFGGVKEELGSLKDRLLSFSGLLHIGFGAEAGRAIFHEIHEGIIKASEGFIEGIRSGEGFGKALEDAGLKALGFKTNLEESREMAASLKETIDQLAKAQSLADVALHGKHELFPGVPGGDAALEALQKAADNAQKKVDPFYQERHRIEVENTYGQFAGEGEYQRAVDDLEKKYAPLRAARDAAVAALQKFKEDAGSASQAHTWLRDPLGSFNALLGIPNYAQDMGHSALAWMRNNVLRPAESIGADIASPFRDLINGFRESHKNAEAAAEEGKKLYESTRTPFEKYAEQINHLDDLLNSKSISQETYSRAAQKYGEEFKKGLELTTPSRQPSNSGGIEGLAEFSKQLQQSILGNDPATGKKQEDGNSLLGKVVTAIETAAGWVFQ